jgi:hypothetical protein
LAEHARVATTAAVLRIARGIGHARVVAAIAAIPGLAAARASSEPRQADEDRASKKPAL